MRIMHIAGKEQAIVARINDYSITVTDEHGKCSHLENNASQKTAIHAAMTNCLSLIQGPPG